MILQFSQILFTEARTFMVRGPYQFTVSPVREKHSGHHVESRTREGGAETPPCVCPAGTDRFERTRPGTVQYIRKSIGKGRNIAKFRPQGQQSRGEIPRSRENFRAPRPETSIGSRLERDLQQRDGRGAEVLARALAEGHELANHSYAHAYDLHHWPAPEIAADLRRCDALLRQIGAYPVR